MKNDTLHNLAVFWSNKLNRHVQKQGIEYQKMILGMEILLHNIPKLILLVIIALILGILPQAAVTWFSFACIRRYASGLHAGNSIICTLMTLLMFAAVPYVLQGMRFNAEGLALALVFIGIGLYKFAPADTATRPILGRKKRARLKIKSILACVFLLLFSLALRDELVYGLVAVGAIYALIAVMPITYLFLRRRYKNYEQYE